MYQKKIVDNFNSLRSRLKDVEIDKLLIFCNWFQCDDIELYETFAKEYRKGRSNTDLILDLYSKRYDLDKENDLDKIAYVYFKNAYNQGFAYHLTSSANIESIKELGLNPMTGLEEEKDVEKLKTMLPEEVLKKLLVFKLSEENKLFFARHPILGARYGKMPEWIIELKTNIR